MIFIYIIKFFLAMIIFTPIYIIIRKPWRSFEKREVFLAAFWLYLFGLFSLTFKGVYQSPEAMLLSALNRVKTLEMINLRPFGIIPDFFQPENRHLFMTNIVGNIVMFIPWGFGLPLLWKKNQSVGRVVFFSLGITVFIETYQLFIWRWTDVDDVLLNFLGGILGGMLYYAMRKLFPSIIKISK